MGVAVQLLCGYVTLPLYALVTQMGSSMKRAVFTERVTIGLKNWHQKAKQSVTNNNSTSSRHSVSLHSKTSDHSVRGYVEIMQTPDNEDLHSVVVTSPPSATTSGSGEEEEKIVPSHDQQEITSHISTSEITTIEEENPKIITRGNYDGEISFGSSWKNVGSSSSIGEIGSITEEDDTDILPELLRD